MKETSGLVLLGACIACVVSFFYKPVVLLYGWEHFVQPLGVPGMGYWAMLGLSIIVNVFTYTSTTTLAKDPDSSVAINAWGLLAGYALCHGVLCLLAN